MDKGNVPFRQHDPQETGPQYLEDLATGYWFSEVLFTAVENNVFCLLEPEGRTVEELSHSLGFPGEGLVRFLNALCAIGLITSHEGKYFNTAVAGRYLVPGRAGYQGDLILWRRELRPSWTGLGSCLRAGGRVAAGGNGGHELESRIRQYISAMDCTARTKTAEILRLFEGVSLEGDILDVGTGSGAVAAGFLEHFPGARATLADIPDVIVHAQAFMETRGLGGRTSLRPANILDPWDFAKAAYDLVILSNIIHAYSEAELPHILSSAAGCLKADGLLLIHDFFSEHLPEKAALFDLNMFINTYNGRVFTASAVSSELVRLGLAQTGLVRLGTDTGLIVASPDPARLASLSIEPKARLATRLYELGFKSVIPVAASDIRVPDWGDLRCRYGCNSYGSPQCPPNAPSPEKTRDLISDYSTAVLLEGEPPTRDFQLRILGAEREAFRSGFYKAFAFWAGPCSVCPTCTGENACRNPRDARPSMESAGIDVFETVKRAGVSLRTLGGKDGFVKYFGLLLLE